MAFNPLPNSIVVKMLQDNQITRVKLFDANPDVIKSMAGTNIEVMVAASNDELSSLATDSAAAAAWVRDNVTQYLASNNNGVNIK
jgi:GTP cyclohydrolase II